VSHRASSRATLERRRPAIRGGAGDDERIQEHLRSLIARGMLPATMPRRLFVGKCLVAHLCTACEQMIEVGDPEFEWTNPADLILYFHRQCVEIYRALPAGHESR
jgi:hypothetical protein